MSYKTERDLRQMLLHQELIESSLSFVSGSEDFILENDIFPSGRTDSDVMRGLRYPNGTGVIAGVTSIGDVDGYDLADGEKIPRKGQLFYRGISIEDIIQQCIKEDRFGFEEAVYLLLFGQLPTNSFPGFVPSRAASCPYNAAINPWSGVFTETYRPCTAFTA